MTPQQRDLITFLRTQPHDHFAIAGKIDDRRFLARSFPPELPLQLTLQSYPSYKHMVGENWMHWHDYYELWIATEGSGQYRVGNHRFAFGPGDIVLVDPLKIHGVLEMEREHRPLVIFFRTDAVAPSGADVDLAFLSAFDRRPDKTAPILQADTAAACSVHGAIRRLAEVWFGNSQTEPSAVTSKFHLLEVLLRLRSAFLAVESCPRESISRRAEREAKLGRVLEYVTQHFQQALAQPEMARVAGMSASRFRLFFKETTGWGFADYVRDFRLQRAAELLRDSAESVAEVAYRTGFADQSHLQRLFKAKYGISPLAYRKGRHSDGRPDTDLPTQTDATKEPHRTQPDESAASSEPQVVANISRTTQPSCCLRSR